MGFAGSAAAFSWESFGDELCKYQFTIALAPYCAQELESEISSTQPNEVQFDIYTNWVVNHDLREQDVKEQRSYLNQSLPMAMAKAKLTIIEARNNGTIQGDAQKMALDEIDQFYTAQQISTLAPQQREVVAINKTLNTINTTDGLSTADVFQNYNSGSCSGIGLEGGATFEKVNYTLYNGTTRQYTEMRANDYGCGSGNPVVASPYTDRQPVYIDRVKIVSGSGDSVKAMNPSDYRDTLKKIDSSRTIARNNVINITDHYYNNYQEGEINVPDELGPLETAIAASTNYETTGAYQYLALTKVQSGYAHNSSYAFQVQWNNQTAWGQLFVTRGTFNNTLEVNKTYNASGETVIFVHNMENGKAEETQLEGEFTILNMRNTQTGDSINSTSLQVTEFYTDGVQDMLKQIENARNVHQKATECSSCGGIVGPTGSWLADFFNSIFPDLPEISGKVAGTIGVVGALLLIVMGAVIFG